MKVLGIIPSRYQSKRFPGKPLANILGKSMIQRVYEQCKKCILLNNIIVATEDSRIYNHVISFGGKAMMTNTCHQNGTDRCNEVIQNLEETYDIIVNIQGDEPLINPEQINKIIKLFKKENIQIATLGKKIKNKKLLFERNNPKVKIDKYQTALNFCRVVNKKDYSNYYQHIGLYAYKAIILKEISHLPVSKNEKKENLEQLRWLDNGYKIKVGITMLESISVDVPNDIIKVEAEIR